MHIDGKSLDEVYRRHGGIISYERKPTKIRNESLKLLLKRKIEKQTQEQTDIHLQKLANQNTNYAQEFKRVQQKHKDSKSVSFTNAERSRQMLQPLQAFNQQKISSNHNSHQYSPENGNLSKVSTYQSVREEYKQHWDNSDLKTFDKRINEMKRKRRRSTDITNIQEYESALQTQYEPNQVYDNQYKIPEKKRYKQSKEEFEGEWDEYEGVNGNRIKDLNKQRDYAIEKIKKEWMRTKDIHMGVLEETPFRLTYTQSQSSQLVAQDFTFPMINMNSSHNRKQSNLTKKSREKYRRARWPKNQVDTELNNSVDAPSGRFTDVRLHATSDDRTVEREQIYMDNKAQSQLARGQGTDRLQQDESVYSDNHEDIMFGQISHPQTQSVNQVPKEQSLLQVSTIHSNASIDGQSSQINNNYVRTKLDSSRVASREILHIAEADDEKEQTFHGSGFPSKAPSRESQEGGSKNTLLTRKVGALRNKSQLVIRSNSNSPGRSAKQNLGHISNAMLYPGRLAAVQDFNNRHASLPKFRKLRRRRKAGQGADSSLQSSVKQILTLESKRNNVGEALGRRNHSVEEQYENSSTAGAAWNPQNGLDVERIYEEMSNTSPERLQENMVANKVHSMIQTAGVRSLVKYEMFIEKNRKLIHRIRLRLEKQEKEKYEQRIMTIGEKMQNLGRSSKLKFPDPSHPQKSNKKSGLVKYCKVLNSEHLHVQQKADIYPEQLVKLEPDQMEQTNQSDEEHIEPLPE